MKITHSKEINFELFHEVFHDLRLRYYHPEIICFCGERFFEKTRGLFIEYFPDNQVNILQAENYYNDLSIEGVKIIPALNLDDNEAIFIVVGQKQNECRDFYQRSRKKQRVKRVRRENKNNKRRKTRKKVR